MKYNRKKGTFGYRKYHRNMQCAVVAVLAAAILIQLGARQLTAAQSFKNVLTVTAILTVLPMANVASPLLAAWRYKSISREFYEACRPYEEKVPMLYELIITSKEMILAVDAAAVHPSGVYLYCPGKTDVKKAEQFLNSMLKSWKLEGNARVITEENVFFKRLSSLKPMTEEEDDGSVDYTVNLLKNMSM